MVLAHGDHQRRLLSRPIFGLDDRAAIEQEPHTVHGPRA